MTAIDITSVAMSSMDEVDLTKLEEIVAAGLETFVEVGTALAEISERRLYRQTHSSFAAYLADRWAMSESRGYQLIGAARVSTIVETAGMVPLANESQARELSGLNDPEVRAVWQRAVEQSGGKPTAAVLADHRERLAPRHPTRTQRRRPLPDVAFRVGRDLGRITNRLEGIAGDDRLRANRAQLRIGLIRDLQRVRDVATKLLAELADDPDLFADARAELGAGMRAEGTVIAVGSNTATVTNVSPELRTIIRGELKVFGVTTMPDRNSKLLTFPAKVADDLQAALEVRKIHVELRRVNG